jgi:hypothetical protein
MGSVINLCLLADHSCLWSDLFSLLRWCSTAPSVYLERATDGWLWLSWVQEGGLAISTSSPDSILCGIGCSETSTMKRWGLSLIYERNIGRLFFISKTRVQNFGYTWKTSGFSRFKPSSLWRLVRNSLRRSLSNWIWRNTLCLWRLW